MLAVSTACSVPVLLTQFQSSASPRTLLPEGPSALGVVFLDSQSSAHCRLFQGFAGLYCGLSQGVLSG